MSEVSSKTLPPGYTFEWTGTAYQEQATGGQTGIVLGLAVLFAFLFFAKRDPRRRARISDRSDPSGIHRPYSGL